MHLAIYVAMAENGVIGRDGGLPWRLSTDLTRFKAGTMGKPVIMGRKTWSGICKPLPGRTNIVVTRDKGFRADGAEIAVSLEDAVALATVRARCMPNADEVCLIGGGEIYAQALPIADRLYVTHVLAEVEGDTVFPEIDPKAWTVLSRQDFPAGEKDSHPTRYVVYERKSAAI